MEREGWRPEETPAGPVTSFCPVLREDRDKLAQSSPGNQKVWRQVSSRVRLRPPNAHMSSLSMLHTGAHFSAQLTSPPHLRTCQARGITEVTKWPCWGHSMGGIPEQSREQAACGLGSPRYS